MAKKDEDTQQLPAVKPDEKKQDAPATPASFADKVEDLMNHAYQQSQVEGEHKHKFADWCNHLGDLWREVKKHA